MPNRMLKSELNKYNIFYKAPCFNQKAHGGECHCEIFRVHDASICPLHNSILYLPNVQRVRLPLVTDKHILISYIVDGELKTLNVFPRYLVFKKKTDKVPYNIVYYAAEPKPTDIITEEDLNECK